MCAGVCTRVQVCVQVYAGMYRHVQVYVHGEKVDACYVRGVPGGR